MEVQATILPGVFVVEPRVFHDDRGYFFESFNEKRFEDLTGVRAVFVQDNQSHSKKDVLRGLHYQAAPYAQGKLVRVVLGSIYDVAVDIRPNSRTFGRWFGVELTSENNRQLWIPEGFAHGFLTLSEGTIVAYKTNEYWHPSSEGCLRWDDPDLAVDWPISQMPILSPKDSAGISLKELSERRRRAA